MHPDRYYSLLASDGKCRELLAGMYIQPKLELCSVSLLDLGFERVSSTVQELPPRVQSSLKSECQHPVMKLS